MEGKKLMLRLKQGARYQSCEGCYALAISKTKDLRVKYSVKVFTDADADNDKRREVFDLRNIEMIMIFQLSLMYSIYYLYEKKKTYIFFSYCFCSLFHI